MPFLPYGPRYQLFVAWHNQSNPFKLAGELSVCKQGGSSLSIMQHSGGTGCFKFGTSKSVGDTPTFIVRVFQRGIRSYPCLLPTNSLAQCHYQSYGTAMMRNQSHQCRMGFVGTGTPLLRPHTRLQLGSIENFSLQRICTLVLIPTSAMALIFIRCRPYCIHHTVQLLCCKH